MNDLEFVDRAVDRAAVGRNRHLGLRRLGRGAARLAPPGPHVDLDLLYPARDWQRVDALDWVEDKRVEWKRTFTLESTLVELYLVERDEHGWFTRHGRSRHDWPDDVFATNGRIAVASVTALADFREPTAERGRQAA